MSAPMSGHSGGTLAAAVSEAGGLGSFGGTDERGPDWVREQMGIIRERTDKSFAVGFITPFMSLAKANFTAALEENAPAIVLSFSDPQPWLRMAKDAGALVICQVQSMEGAELAVAGGSDVLIAQGNEAGGHCGTAAMLPLLVRVVGRYPDTPVLAAGGIAAGRALAAVLAAGADGASVGTAFLATPEAVEVPEVYKERVVASDGEDTIFTRVYDLIDGLPWPEEIGARVYANQLVREWEGRDKEIVEQREALRERTSAAYRKDPEFAAVYMGESAGDVDSIRPAAEVLANICEGGEELLRRSSS
jgi:nitronate monooxygenase